MPTLKVFAEGTDYDIYVVHAVWNTARGAATGTVRTAEADGHASAYLYLGNYYVDRTFMRFDLSALPAGVVVTGISLFLDYTDERESTVAVMKSTAADTPAAADFNNFSGTYYAVVQLGVTGYTEFALNAQAIADVTSNFKLCLREYAHDYGNSTPGTTYRNKWNTTRAAGTTSDPYLEVYYQYEEDVAGSMTPTGDLVKKTLKQLAGSMTSTGALVAKTLKQVAGAMTPTGALGKKTLKQLAGSMTPTGALATVRKRFVSLAGSMTPTGALATKYTQVKALAGSMTPTGALSTMLIAGPWSPPNWGDYRVELLNSSRTLVCLLSDIKALRYKDTVNEGGEATFRIHRDSDRASYFTDDDTYFLLIWRKGKLVWNGISQKDTRNENYTDSRQDAYVDCKFQQLTDMLNWRVVLPGGDVTGQYTGLTADDAFRKIVRDTFGASAPATPTNARSRELTWMSVEADTSAAAASPVLDARGQTVYQFLKRRAAAYDLDFWCEFDSSYNVKFRTAYGWRDYDRSTGNGDGHIPVILDDCSVAGIISATYTRDATDHANATISKDYSVDQEDATAIGTHFYREALVDGMTADDLATILGEHEVAQSYTQTMVEMRGLRFFQDFGLGTKVTVGNKSMAVSYFDGLVTEYEIIVEDETGKETLTVKVGEPEYDVVDQGSGGGGSGGDAARHRPSWTATLVWALLDTADHQVDPDSLDRIKLNAYNSGLLIEKDGDAQITFTPAWDREGDGPGVLTQTNAGDNVEIRSEAEVMMMRVFGATGSTEWDGSSVFKQGGAGVWYSWPALAPEGVDEVLAVASVAGSAVGLQWSAGIIMRQHLIIGEWHTAAAEQTGYLKNTAGTLTWASLAHIHTMSSESYHRHEITEEDTHTHTIPWSTSHSHSGSIVTSDTSETDGHTHEYDHITSYNGGADFTTSTHTHNHGGVSGVGGAHSHTGYTAYVAVHSHTVITAL